MIIEWAEKMLRLLPDELLMVEIIREDENTRQLILKGKGKRYGKIVEEMDEHQKYRFFLRI